MPQNDGGNRDAPCLISAHIPWLKTSIPKQDGVFAMRAMFVACCLGLLLGFFASPVQARTFCKFKDCQQTSVQKIAPKHTASSVQKAARKHAATPVHKLGPKHTASAHAPKHTATKAVPN